MKDYNDFSTNDFLEDPHFQTWVLTPNENSKQFWNTWLKAHPEKREKVEEACLILNSLKFSRYKLSNHEVADLWDQIQHNRDNRDIRKKKHAPLGKAGRIAASIALIAMLSTVLWLSSINTIEYQTAFGETKTILLPDSSSVTLNSNSSLKLTSNWQDRPMREVFLKGEGFFSVVHKKDNKPFRVVTDDGLCIEVLGTTFNVNYRSAGTRVVLNSGKIKLNLPDVKTGDDVIMAPGEMVEYKEKKYTKLKVDPQVYTAWTQNKLILNHTSLREMINILKENYGITVEASEELLKQTVSGSMPLTNGDSLVEQVARAFRLRVVHEDNNTYLKE